MKYYDGMKFVTAEGFQRKTNIKGYNVANRHAHLWPDGMLEIGAAYPWDGNTGPVIDFKKTIEASCVHDVLCDMVNSGLLPMYIQYLIDMEYYNICREKGFFALAAMTRFKVIRWFQIRKKKLFKRKIREA